MNLDTRKYLESLRKPNNQPSMDERVQATAAGGNSYWRCVLLHDMGDAEEQDTHNVFVDLLDEMGERLKPTTLIRIRYGWENMAADVGELFAPCEKEFPQPLANVAIFGGAKVWVEVDDRRGSDRVVGLSSAPDGHESIYAVFQLVNPNVLPTLPSRKVIVDYDALLDLEMTLKGALRAVQTMRGAV